VIRLWLFVLAVVCLDSAGNLLLTRGIKQVGAVRTLREKALLRWLQRIAQSPTIALGIGCLAIAFFLLLDLLSWADLSFIAPATAMSYPLSLLGSRYWLKETVTTTRLIGTLFVCLGVALISWD
jgi:transporter family protein